jgi:SpoVK/Ycf46/Vps4 family AAA+-type ATPase
VLQLTWDDVGGLSAVKQRLQEAVLWPQQHTDALARLGATAPKGVLLYGPPGCSKTLLVRAVAATAGLNFLSVKGGELYSKYVGESERAVAALFARARGAAPAVVFFDEIDGLVAARGDAGGAGIGERVLAQLLTELDGLQVRGSVEPWFILWSNCGQCVIKLIETCTVLQFLVLTASACLPCLYNVAADRAGWLAGEQVQRKGLVKLWSNCG